MSLERSLPALPTESAVSSKMSDIPTHVPADTPVEAAHDRWILSVNALTNLVGNWGNTLRLAFLVVTVRILVGPIPWDQLGVLFRSGS